MEYVVKETSIWGDTSKIRSPKKHLRLLLKSQLCGRYPFVDHYKVFAYKPRDQRGPARESQTFIESYAYRVPPESEPEFIQQLTDIGLRYYREPCEFHGHQAYRILIMDVDVDLDRVLVLLPRRQE